VEGLRGSAQGKTPRKGGLFSAILIKKKLIMKSLQASGRDKSKGKEKKPRVGASPGPAKKTAAEQEGFDENVQL